MKTTKEEAQEIVGRFLPCTMVFNPVKGFEENLPMAKVAAIEALDMVIEGILNHFGSNMTLEELKSGGHIYGSIEETLAHYQKLKQEIEKL